MRCANCSRRVKPGLKVCPGCSHEISSEEAPPLGAKYWAEAFTPDSYRIGEMVFQNRDFYLVFTRYVLAVVTDFSQLVHFRAQVIHEANVVAGSARPVSPAQIWCALSLVSDMYFSHKATLYGWSEDDERQVTVGWFNLLAPAFIAGHQNKRLEASVVREWISKFVALHTRDEGPMAACTLCTSKCRFQYEAGQAIQSDRIKLGFDSLLGLENASVSQSAARYSNLLAVRLSGKPDIDLSYCLAIHLTKDLVQSMDELAGDIRSSLSVLNTEPSPAVASSGDNIRDQVLAVIDKQALAGAPWRQICAGPMEVNKITVTQVEEALQRIKSAPGS